MSDEVINTQAFVIQDQLRTISNLRCVIADLTRQCQESDAMLRQALDALESVLKANRVGIRPPTTVMQAERQLDQIRAAGTAAESSIAAIKQHLGEV